MNLSVVILTFNSQKRLFEVLKSVEFANEVVIVDSGSSDDSLEIAAKFKNVKIYKQKWLGFGAQKQFGVDMAKNEWVFVLDSDEVILEELKCEILQTLLEPKFDAYKVARVNIFFEKEVRNLGLYPDYSVRLFSKFKAKFDGREIHEKVILNDKNAKFGKLKNHFKHYAYEDIAQFITKQNQYSSLGAKRNKFKAVFSPFWTFFKLYFLKLGFLDGWEGFLIAKLYSQYTFWKYIK